MTVTLNAAVDKTLRVANLQIGLRHRCAQGLVQPGGKGINVARALKALGQPVLATGLAGGRTGTRIVEELTAAGILNDFVRIQDESRTSTLLVDPALGNVDGDRRVRAVDRGSRARDGRREARVPDARCRDGGVRREPAT